MIPEKSPPAQNADRPWFVALLQGVAGWLAGIFLLAFIGLMFKPESSGAIFAVGALLLAGAWALYRADRDAVFLDQLALAISIAGQFAVAWGIVKDDSSGLPIAATLLALQIFVLLIMPNKVARTLAALFATIAWVFTVRFLLRPGQGEQMFFDGGHGEYAPPLGAWTLPVAWALTWVPLLALAWWLIRNETQWMSSGLRRHARPLLTGTLLGLSLGGIAAEPFTVFALGIESMGMRFSWWALFPLLSVALAMFSAWGAFRVRSHGIVRLRGVRGAAAPVALLLSVRHHAHVEVRDHADRRRGAAARRSRAAQACPARGACSMSATFSRRLLVIALVLVLGAVNWSIFAKERIKTNGERIFLALAPVDPRSLMQGDYMALRFEIADRIDAKASGSAPLLVDSKGVATLNPDPGARGPAHSLSRAQRPGVARHQCLLLRGRHRRAIRRRALRGIPYRPRER